MTTLGTFVITTPIAILGLLVYFYERKELKEMRLNITMLSMVAGFILWMNILPLCVKPFIKFDNITAHYMSFQKDGIKFLECEIGPLGFEHCREVTKKCEE